MQGMNNLNSWNTHHISPLHAICEVYIVKILEKTGRIITGLCCIYVYTGW